MVAAPVKMDALQNIGYLPFGFHWPFQVKGAEASVNGHEDGSDEDSHAKEDVDGAPTLEEKADVWDDMIKDLQTKGSVCMSPVQQLSDGIFL